jgi:hypothetical protein
MAAVHHQDDTFSILSTTHPRIIAQNAEVSHFYDTQRWLPDIAVEVILYI